MSKSTIKRLIFSLVCVFAMFILIKPAKVSAIDVDPPAPEKIISEVEIVSGLTDASNLQNYTDLIFKNSAGYFDVPENANYEITDIRWKIVDKNGNKIDPYGYGHLYPEEGYDYYVNITLETKEGYWFNKERTDINCNQGWDRGSLVGTLYSKYGDNGYWTGLTVSKSFDCFGTPVTQHKMTFDSTESLGSMGPIYVLDGFPYTLPSVEKCDELGYSRDGYRLYRWKYIENGETKYLDPKAVINPVSKDYTFYPVWVNNEQKIKTIAINGLENLPKQIGDPLDPDALKNQLSVPTEYADMYEIYYVDIYCVASDGKEFTSRAIGLKEAIEGYSYYVRISLKEINGWKFDANPTLTNTNLSPYGTLPYSSATNDYRVVTPTLIERTGNTKYSLYCIKSKIDGMEPDSNGDYWLEPGTEVTLIANEPSEGEKFKCYNVTYNSSNETVNITDINSSTTTLTMPSGFITIRAEYESIPYDINVTNGNAKDSSSTPITTAIKGTTVTITADAAPSGKVFDKWVVNNGSITLGDEAKETTTFTMPAGKVELTATYKDIQYDIDVTNGSAKDSSSTPITTAIKGTTVTITADAAPSGKVFDKWVVNSGSITLGDETKETTTFTMPEGKVELTATYVDDTPSGDPDGTKPSGDPDGTKPSGDPDGSKPSGDPDGSNPSGDPDAPDPNPLVTAAGNNSTVKLNKKLTDLINKAASVEGQTVIYFNDFNGDDCLTSDVFDLLNANPNITLVLDYTFFDTNTNRNIHVHAVINQAILSHVVRDDIEYFGPACISGFVQYYYLLPAEIRNKNY